MRVICAGCIRDGQQKLALASADALAPWVQRNATKPN